MTGCFGAFFDRRKTRKREHNIYRQFTCETGMVGTTILRRQRHKTCFIYLVMDCSTASDLTGMDACSSAILCLMEGDADEALQRLSFALQESRKRLQQLVGSRLHDSWAKSFDTSVFPLSLEGALVNEEGRADVGFASPFRMFRFIYSIEGTDSDSDFLLPELVVVLLYNLAVVHHEIGVCSRDSSMIRRALHFYDLARSALCSAIEAKRHNLSISLFELELAILNNLGHTYSFFLDNHEKMAATLEALRCTLLSELGRSELGSEAHSFFRGYIMDAGSISHDGSAPAA